MNEKEPTENEPNLEEKQEILGRTLREIAAEIGFIETEELRSLEAKIFESRDNDENLLALLKQFQEMSEEITRRVEDRAFALSRAGLIVRRAAILYKCNRMEDYSDDVYHALTDLDNLANSGYPEAIPIIEKIEAFDKGIKEAREFAEFCRQRWGFSEDEMSSLAASGDLSAAIANATYILMEKDPDFDEGEFFQSLIEAGFIEEEPES